MHSSSLPPSPPRGLFLSNSTQALHFQPPRSLITILAPRPPAMSCKRPQRTDPRLSTRPCSRVIGPIPFLRTRLLWGNATFLRAADLDGHRHHFRPSLLLHPKASNHSAIPSTPKRTMAILAMAVEPGDERRSGEYCQQRLILRSRFRCWDMPATTHPRVNSQPDLEVDFFMLYAFVLMTYAISLFFLLLYCLISTWTLRAGILISASQRIRGLLWITSCWGGSSVGWR